MSIVRPENACRSVRASPAPAAQFCISACRHPVLVPLHRQRPSLAAYVPTGRVQSAERFRAITAVRPPPMHISNKNPTTVLLSRSSLTISIS